MMLHKIKYWQINMYREKTVLKKEQLSSTVLTKRSKTRKNTYTFIFCCFCSCSNFTASTLLVLLTALRFLSLQLLFQIYCLIVDKASFIFYFLIFILLSCIASWHPFLSLPTFLLGCLMKLLADASLITIGLGINLWVQPNIIRNNFLDLYLHHPISRAWYSPGPLVYPAPGSFTVGFLLWHEPPFGLDIVWPLPESPVPPLFLHSLKPGQIVYQPHWRLISKI